MKHILSKGTYYVGDPAYLIKKNNEGDTFINKIWDLFYQDMNMFHLMHIDDIKFYVFRTEGGDGFFDGVGTDTGVIMIIDLAQTKDHIAFKQDIEERGCKIITLNEDTEAEVISHNLDIKGYLQVKTQ
jgi:hypothetical protein